MKKSTYVIYICIAVLICIIPFAMMGIHKTTTTSENKVLAELPSFNTEEGSFNVNYMSELGDYFLDRFAFRQELVSLNGMISAKLLNTSTVNDVIKGTNDWLYYTATLDDYRHDNSVSERMLYDMAHNVKLMQEYCENKGNRFVFTIAPNKNTLYGDNMPGRYIYFISKESDFERLTPYLLSEGINYVDMVELFNAQDEVLYFKKDSHWNNKGAVLAYNALLDAAQKDHERYDDVTPEIVDDYIGDLNRMLYADLAKPEKDYKYKDVFPFAYLDPDSTVEDMTIRTINPNATENLLIYRDSFGNSLLPYMASAFENAYFSKVVPYPLSDMELIDSDVVIVEKVERHLPTLAQIPPQHESVTVANGIENFVSENSDTGVLDESKSDKGDTDSSKSEDKKEIAIEINNEGDLVKISGELNEGDIDTDSPIYVEVKYEDVTFTYDAFTTSSKKSDYGFVVYTPPENGEIQEVKVIGKKDSESVIFVAQK